MPLTGTFQRSLDDKQRLSLPKPLRDELVSEDEPALFLAPETDQSLSLYSADIFNRRAQRLEQNGAFILRLNVDDIGVSDQHCFEGSLKHDGGPGADFKGDAVA